MKYSSEKRPVMNFMLAFFVKNLMVYRQISFSFEHLQKVDSYYAQ